MKRHLKKMKFALLGTTIMLLGMTNVFAQSGTAGPLTWELTGTSPNMTLTISVTDGTTGAMPDYYYDNPPPWRAYCQHFTTIILGNGVTSIGDCAFSGCSFTSITIPNSVISIGYAAFLECEPNQLRIKNYEL